MNEPLIPIYIEYLWPTLVVIAEHGGYARTGEIIPDVIARMDLTPDQVAVEYPPSAKAKGSKIVHRIRFALTWLREMKAIESSERAVWRLTPIGRGFLAAGDARVREAYNEMKKDQQHRAKKNTLEDSRAPETDTPQEPSDPDDYATEDSWKATLLDTLTSLAPDVFERLCARLLREAGCTDVVPSGQPGDQGVDGVGILRVSLLSFPVYFQAKRYQASQRLGPEKVRELRGALQGRGEKGILITTGYFTRSAVEEANRAGAPVDLIDGDQLCDLLLEYGLGVEHRPVVVPEFFSDL